MVILLIFLKLVSFILNYRETTRATGNLYHIFQPNSFRDVRNLYQNKASIDMTLIENK